MSAPSALLRCPVNHTLVERVSRGNQMQKGLRNQWEPWIWELLTAASGTSWEAVLEEGTRFSVLSLLCVVHGCHLGACAHLHPCATHRGRAGGSPSQGPVQGGRHSPGTPLRCPRVMPALAVFCRGPVQPGGERRGGVLGGHQPPRQRCHGHHQPGRPAAGLPGQPGPGPRFALSRR